MGQINNNQSPKTGEAALGHYLDMVIFVTRSELIRYNYVYFSREKDPNPKTSYRSTSCI